MILGQHLIKHVIFLRFFLQVGPLASVDGRSPYESCQPDAYGSHVDRRVRKGKHIYKSGSKHGMDEVSQSLSNGGHGKAQKNADLVARELADVEECNSEDCEFRPVDTRHKGDKSGVQAGQ